MKHPRAFPGSPRRRDNPILDGWSRYCRTYIAQKHLVCGNGIESSKSPVRCTAPTATSICWAIECSSEWVVATGGRVRGKRVPRAAATWPASTVKTPPLAFSLGLSEVCQDCQLFLSGRCKTSHPQPPECGSPGPTVPLPMAIHTRLGQFQSTCVSLGSSAVASAQRNHRIYPR